MWIENSEQYWCVCTYMNTDKIGIKNKETQPDNTTMVTFPSVEIQAPVHFQPVNSPRSSICKNDILLW